MLTQRELARTLLPVGDMTKPEVRAHAQRLGLRTATKPESMDVCFITKGARVEFLAARAEMTPGRIVDTSGSEVGEHDGVAAFTVGQRRGLGVASGERRYVVDIDAPSATVTIGSKQDLLRRDVALHGLTFVDTRPDDASLLAQVRAHGDVAAARLCGDVVQFGTPQPRVARGQVVALYDGEVLVGGGIAA
jgi:tRNA-specific 2-thiouridylase